MELFYVQRVLVSEYKTYLNTSEKDKKWATVQLKKRVEEWFYYFEKLSYESQFARRGLNGLLVVFYDENLLQDHGKDL